MSLNRKKLVIVLVTLTLVGISIACTKAGNKHIMDTDTTPAKYLALGDSYTIGEAVPENERFPAQATALLLKEGIDLGTPQYIATTGWTTLNLQKAIADQNPQGRYDAVTLLIGVNDQYQHLPIAGYPQHFTQLLQKAISLAGNRKERVFVLSIPDYSVTPFGGGSAAIRDDIDAYNAISKKITIDSGVSYIYITDESRKAATDPGLVAGDGLHPSGRQYALWAKRLVPEMEKVLK